MQVPLPHTRDAEETLKERGGKRERNCKPRKFFRFFPTKKGGKTNFSSPLFRKKGEHGKVFPRAFYSLPRSVVWERGKGEWGGAKKFPLPPSFLHRLSVGPSVVTLHCLHFRVGVGVVGRWSRCASDPRGKEGPPIQHLSGESDEDLPGGATAAGFAFLYAP